jgi:nucleoside diphosphate kinase
MLRERRPEKKTAHFLQPQEHILYFYSRKRGFCISNNILNFIFISFVVIVSCRNASAIKLILRDCQGATRPNCAHESCKSNEAAMVQYEEN